MPRAIKNKVAENVKKEVSKELLAEFKKVNSGENLDDFFKKFMTAGEKDLIFRRMAIIKFIDQGKKYKEIKKILDVSDNTISKSKDIMAGRGYGQNPNRKRVYSPFAQEKPKHKFKPGLRYKGAESIVNILDPLFDP